MKNNKLSIEFNEQELPDNVKFINTWMNIIRKNRNNYKNYNVDFISFSQEELDELCQKVNNTSKLINDLF